jgi:hypothetical protein
MLLDRIDIDAHGPLQRVELGPLAEHLNVVLAPAESGKTAICRFIRDALVDRAYPLGMFSSSTGRVVLADRHGMVHCHREKDGTTTGRRRIEFESRGDFRGRYDQLENPWLQGISQSTDAAAALASLELPEAIVDGVITDTNGVSVARVVSACVRSGLDSNASYQALPLQVGASYAERNGRYDSLVDQDYETHRKHRRELAEIDAELARHSGQEADYDSLISRRDRLRAILSHVRTAQPRSNPVAHQAAANDQRAQLERRASELQQQTRQLRAQQSELRRRVADLDLDVASLDHVTRPADGAYSTEYSDCLALCRDRDTTTQELDRVTAQLDRCLRESAEVGRALRKLNVTTVNTHPVPLHHASERDTLASELRRVEDRIASLSRLQWLRSQRTQLLKQMRLWESRAMGRSPLSEAASRWLIRLSAGRLRRVEWTDTNFQRESRSFHSDVQEPTGVTIDGRDETRCRHSDRALACTAVRMAAGDFLAHTGRPVPLVLELHHDLMEREPASDDGQSTYQRSAPAYCEPGDHLRSNQPVAAALRDYVHAGRQVLVLTSSRDLARQLARVGARSFQIHSQRIIHPHRPLWRSRYQGDAYVGPHPYTVLPQEPVGGEWPGRATTARKVNEREVNRNFDAASYETAQYQSAIAGVDESELALPARSGIVGAPPNEVHADTSPRSDTSPRTDWARDGVSHRDGFYYADAFTTDSPASVHDSSPVVDLAKRQQVTPSSPFYLSVDSPIDQAPSVDAVAAARLRALNVTHVTHLMQQDPNRLSDALGLASVDAATVRRWQAECRLACRVPNLRGFDARILVGCGVTTPGQLAATHPTDLLHEVETFLATERGQRILLSGTSQELCRLMTWIAMANRAAERQGSVDHESESAPAISDRPRMARFLLHRDSPVVDAPSIGPNLAEKLQGAGVGTVDDLLAADPDSLAAELQHPRIDAATITRWQQQAGLVCRIPLLSGDHARLLVASNVTSLDELAEADAAGLHESLVKTSRGNQGKRILRGTAPPDAKQVKQWVRWARNQRTLRAA